MAREKKTLKDFFSGLFRKYPERAKKDPQNIECVYAGPEYFEKRAKKVRVKNEEPEVDVLYGAPSLFKDLPGDSPEEEDPDLVEVYNGPEYYERNTDDGPEEDDPDIIELYAGPEYWDELERESEEAEEPEEGPAPEPPVSDPDIPDMAPVYAGPEYWEPPVEQAAPGEDDSLAECVYAGPEYWDPSAALEPVEEEKEEGGSVFIQPSPPIAFVYGGPDYFNQRREQQQMNPQMFMTVYAGPQYWNPPVNNENDGQAPFNGVYAGPPMMMVYAAPPEMTWQKINQVPETNEEKPAPVNPENRTFCSCCGYMFEFNSKFCPECGTPNPDWDEPEVTDV